MTWNEETCAADSATTSASDSADEQFVERRAGRVRRAFPGGGQVRLPRLSRPSDAPPEDLSDEPLRRDPDERDPGRRPRIRGLLLDRIAVRGTFPNMSTAKRFACGILGLTRAASSVDGRQGAPQARVPTPPE